VDVIDSRHEMSPETFLIPKQNFNTRLSPEVSPSRSPVVNPEVPHRNP